MTTMNISLPDSMKAYVDQRVSQEGYGTSSEYVRELIRRDKDRSQLRAMMLKGLESPVTGQADAAYFQTLRQRANQRNKA
ncbi:MAG: type II toxin-antitoxin system ParD family antitoxin [Polaromonas sp.]|nr:type II toxin-antitoxin system ParD family antitoxin [Polaromonas sp.]